jgi:Na+-transporting NADH:ubiquinone oxidoreductase subunit F
VAEAGVIESVSSRRAFLGRALYLGSGAALSAATYPFRGRVSEMEDLTHDTKRIRFRVADAKGFSFTPGQYTFLKVPDAFVNRWNVRYSTSHKDVARPYSFASSSSRLPYFDLMVKLAGPPAGKNVPPGIASTYIHTELKIGDEVSLSAPTGNLYLRQDTGRPIVIVAGGTGVAPFISLLEYWFEKGYEKNNDIYLFFGVRSRRDLFWHDRFQDWGRAKPKFRYIPALSNPAPADNWDGETGYIQLIVDKRIAAPSDADAYLAGPPVMMREAVKVLTAKGIGRDRIHFDEIAVVE